ncbi:MAG: hypothetical protein F4Y27_04405 [Acidimicrobiaceae bacterium]|nr:hypothetical protein [Acidimicrobiaceae bacterium]MYA73898.1 hypothetical protein [Acidimicrobiaceae bacterium]MYC43847.1 hypothetical protein [Acidimicrobiaceae bacterium]MYG54923.1 hypothetical protein [Acidimicrobiaceae bacterium]MYJ98546.1 hypothetical protein [Acidimicrobiaceae bacterium]
MPTSFLGLALLLVVVPGLGYQLGRESKQPTRELAGFRETVSLVFAGLVSISVSLLAFGLIRWIAPDNTPNMGQFLRTPGPYLRDHLPYISFWTLAVTSFATSIAYCAGRYFPRARGSHAYESAWWRAFKTADQYRTYVGCELTDGTYVGGTLWTYNATVEETPDREIALAAPVSYRPSDDADPVTFEDVAIVTVSASRIKFMTVTYVDEDREDQPHKKAS